MTNEQAPVEGWVMRATVEDTYVVYWGTEDRMTKGEEHVFGNGADALAFRDTEPEPVVPVDY